MSDKELTDIVENENNLDESAASETLKPNPTRTEMLATFTSLLAQLKGEDLSHFFNDSIKKLGVENVKEVR
jgi:hypothetical protein